MAQRDGAPPPEWEERRDRAMRRAIEHLEDELRAQYSAAVKSLYEIHSEKIRDLEERFVSHRFYALGIVAMLAAVFLLAQQYMAPTRESVVAAVQKMDAASSVIAGRLTEQDKKIERQAASVEAVMRVTVDGKPRKQAQHEWETKTGMPRIDASP